MLTIHGNHDDPSGADNLSAVDILSGSRLINYFGKLVPSLRFTTMLGSTPEVMPGANRAGMAVCGQPTCHEPGQLVLQAELLHCCGAPIMWGPGLRCW